MLTILPMWRSPIWWIRVWDYPRLQIVVLLALVIVVELIMFDFVAEGLLLLLVTFACLGWQISRIWMYTPVAPKQVQDTEATPSDDSVAILIANVLQSNRRADLFLREVEAMDPDLVLTVETNQWWADQLAPLRERYPHHVLHPLDNTYGMLLFSRLELSEITLLERIAKDIPSIFARVRLRSGRQFDLHCVHPEPPQPVNDVDQRDAELLLVGKQVVVDKRPTVVCGDLNDVAWSHTTRLFQRISGLLDPRVGRGIYPTFHAEHWFARWPLDHVFHDACFRLQELKVLNYFGSDHFPVFIRLQFEADAEEAQKPEHQAEEDDVAEADEKIEEGAEAEAKEEAAESGSGKGRSD
ncbi:endonuclease/exonuclease/phosphatase family protein [Geminicoccus roseus]|uniref:endonuclease/exonuclease/phosphatase family protein n=1 Tax=Geminicoccus roseus TaxID=404900 RepID=UPI00041CF46C|nr:endonuclease/exonuclease/phosphatase family protein [Geminicoccus roseus]